MGGIDEKSWFANWVARGPRKHRFALRQIAARILARRKKTGDATGRGPAGFLTFRVCAPGIAVDDRPRDSTSPTLSECVRRALGRTPGGSSRRRGRPDEYLRSLPV